MKYFEQFIHADARIISNIKLWIDMSNEKMIYSFSDHRCPK